jgi:hypothetical protein
MADSESSSLKGSGSRSRRAWTVSTESEAMDSSGRSNGRSSIDSNERPKTQGGESSAKAGSSGFSKLISSRRRRKKKNNNGDSVTDVPPVPGIVTEQDLQQSRSNESRNSNSVIPSSNTSSIAPEGEAFNLLTDDSEPERYAI